MKKAVSHAQFFRLIVSISYRAKRSNINAEHDGKRNNRQGLTEIYRENAAIPSHHG